MTGMSHAEFRRRIPDPESLWRLLGQQLRDPHASWSVGTFGAIAEFLHSTDALRHEFIGDRTMMVATEEGGIRLESVAGILPVAYERSPAASEGWSHGIALCLPETRCVMHERAVITELGPDHAAMLAEDRDGILFDLGLGTRHADFCVRSADPETIRQLRAASGRELFDPELALAAQMPLLSPHRVLLTRFARAEVRQPIPAPDGRSPDGPHTHLLPQLLATGRTHPATEPIPEGWVPCAHVFPAHPLAEPNGHAIAFVPERHERFQELLARFGDPELNQEKQRALLAIREGRSPQTNEALASIVRLVLRQLAHQDPTAASLPAWQRTCTSAQRTAQQEPSHPDEH